MTTQKLRVYWIPQVPGEAFYVDVANLVEAKLLLDTLANYDIFQFDNRIKGDYCNAGGLEVWEDEEWCEWWDEESGKEIDDYTIEELRARDECNLI
jgi:hypothetical protein